MYHQPQRNQMAPAPVYYPVMPPQFYHGNDPATFPSPNGHWPLDDGSRGYAYPPVQCHGCCNHNYFPGHFAGSPTYPCHNHVPLVPSYSPFCYPIPQGMYPPLSYFPPLHCNMEPRYEYDKELLKGDGHRCSEWCQNRLNGEQGGNVKIVEEEPDVEKKPSSSLVPFEAKKHPYPAAFLQLNNTKNAEENKNLDDSRSKVRDKNFGAQASENQHQRPFLWNGWFPYDMSRVQSSNQEVEKKDNNQQLEEASKSHQPTTWREWFPFELSKLGSMKQGEEHKGTQHQIDDDKQRNLPFPIFWMPYQPSVTEGSKLGSMKQDKEQKGTQHQNDDDKQRNLPFPIVWMPYQPSVTEGEAKPEIATERDVTKKNSSGEGKVPLQSINFPPENLTNNKETTERNIPSEGSNVSNTNRVVKVIPVKQLKEQVEEDKKTSSKIEEETKKKPPEEGTNKESSSPRKTSKLPPVCLRVEPLPKRKGANGNSRSPSPPADKRKAHDVSAMQTPNLKKKGGEEDQSEIEEDGSKVAKRSKSTEKTADTANESFSKGDVKLGCESGDNVSHDNAITNENAKRSNDRKEDQAVNCDVGQKVHEDLEAKMVAAKDESLTTTISSEEAEESKKVKFSDAEAATMIQAAYRGFEVRKWEPLRKLKKLAEVKEGVAGIRSRIQALDSFSNLKDYDKEKNMIMEMIMSLLLKLDAVQGLHVSIRDVRKSIAKELVSLQETLDSSVFMDKSSPSLLEQYSGLSSEEIPSGLKNEDIHIELQKEGDIVNDHDLSKIDSKVSPPVKKCEEQQFHETDSLPNFKDFENSVARLNSESMVDELKDVSGTSSECFQETSDSTLIVESNDEEHDVQSPMEGSSRDDEELGEKMSNFEDVSEEEMRIETPNISSIGEHKQGPNTTYTSNDEEMITEDSKVEEMFISSQEHQAPEEMQEAGQKDKEEEQITEDPKVEDMIISSREHEVPEEMQNGSQEGKLGEKITEDPKDEMIISTQAQEAPEETQEGSQEGKDGEKITRDLKDEDMIISIQEQEAPEETRKGSQEEKDGEKITGDLKDEEMIISTQAQEGPEETEEGSQESKNVEKITEDLKDEEMIISIQEQEAPEKMQEGSQRGKEEEITEDSKVEEMIISSQENEVPEEMQEGSQKGKGEEKSAEDLNVEEMVISSQEKLATEDLQVGSQEGNVEEKIIDSVFLETVSPLGDTYVDIPIELPKEIENTPDPCDAEPDSRLEQEVSSTKDNDEQLEEAELQKEQLESDTDPVSGGQATMLVHGEVSSFINDDVQEDLQKGDQGLGTENLSESGGCDEGKVVLVTTREGEPSGEEYNHVGNSCVEEEIEKNGYGLVSGGSEVVQPGVEKSDEIDADANVLRPDADVDKMENIGHVVIPDLKMDVLAGASDQADELDITKPSPTGSQASLQSEMVRENDQENNRKLVEENEKLRDMMEKLLEAGSKQLSTISELSSRIDDLEKRLAAKKKKQQRIRRRPKALHRQGITV